MHSNSSQKSFFRPLFSPKKTEHESQSILSSLMLTEQMIGSKIAQGSWDTQDANNKLTMSLITPIDPSPLSPLH